jgi:hypothetical protein
MSRRRHLSAVLLTALVAGCVPTTIGGALSTAQTAIGLREVGTIYSNFWEARRAEIPLAGTYRLTYSFPGEAPVTVYIRTLRNANMPIAVDRNSAEPGSLFYRGDRVTFEGYMVNVLGASSLRALPESLGGSSDGAPPPEDRPDLGGFLVVTEPLGEDPLGRQQFVGSFWVAAAEGGSPETERLRLLLARTQATFEEHERKRAETARAQARGDRFRVRRNEPQREEDWNLFAGIKSVIPLASDGSVSGEMIYGIEGTELMRINYERISLDAFEIPAENLDRPGFGDWFRGYRDALRGDGKD